MKSNLLMPTPWDAAAFEMPTWEILEYSEEALNVAANFPGHQSLKVDPLENKQLLQTHGFYYCDTLIEPVCSESDLLVVYHNDLTISKDVDYEEVISQAKGMFVHGRFHRDFRLTKEMADVRYDRWLRQLLDERQVYGLYWRNRLAGFIGFRANILVLHAVFNGFRGKGLSKYWWSMVCVDMLKNEADELTSSISATNMAVLNLYASLGFSFRRPKDAYHRLVD